MRLNIANWFSTEHIQTWNYNSTETLKKMGKSHCVVAKADYYEREKIAEVFQNTSKFLKRKFNLLCGKRAGK